MDIGDFVRSFLGLGGRQNRGFPPSENFPGPDFEQDCDCPEHGPPTDKHDHSEFHFSFGNMDQSLDEVIRHFHQMEEMMKGFGIASGHFPPESRPGIMDKPESPPDDRGHRQPFFNFDFNLPFQPNVNKDKNNPRDIMLKENKEEPPTIVLPAAPPTGERSRPFDNPFGRVFPRNQPHPDQRKDTDLDGKVSDTDVLALIKKSEEEKRPAHPYTSSREFASWSWTSGPSVAVTVRDGKIERKKVVKDSSGRVESTVTRSVNGQSHTVTTVTGPQGLEERWEDFQNMDQNDIPQFEDKWRSPSQPRQDDPPGPVLVRTPPNQNTPRHRPSLNITDRDLFSKFFGSPPK